MHINPLNDAENRRQQRNLTNSQRKNSVSTKEGVLVNNLVKIKNAKTVLHYATQKILI